MMDETQIQDVDEMITQYGPEQIDAEDLYDLREDALLVGADLLAARIEIERNNVLAYDEYCPTFTQSELLDLGILLMRVEREYYDRGRQSQIDRVQDMAETFLDGFDIDSDDVNIEVKEVDGLPTVEEVTEDE